MPTISPPIYDPNVTLALTILAAAQTNPNDYLFGTR